MRNRPRPPQANRDSGEVAATGAASAGTGARRPPPARVRRHRREFAGTGASPAGTGASPAGTGSECGRHRRESGRHRERVRQARASSAGVSPHRGRPRELQAGSRARLDGGSAVPQASRSRFLRAYRRGPQTTAPAVERATSTAFRRLAGPNALPDPALPDTAITARSRHSPQYPSRSTRACKRSQPQRTQKDAMSLSGLLRAVGDDPALGHALEHAALRAAGGGDLIAPPALRPVLAAALTGLTDAEPDRRRARLMPASPTPASPMDRPSPMTAARITPAPAGSSWP